MSIYVEVSCEVDMADLDLSDDVIDIVAGIDMSLEYKVPIRFTKGEEAVLWKLPEDCHPGSEDEWELDGFDSLKVAADIAQPAMTSLTAYEVFRLILYIQADINTYVDSDLFSELAYERGNEANSEGPDEPDHEPEDWNE